MERQSMAVDIACVGFGPAMAGFLTTLSRRLAAQDRTPLESAASPGMPLQVVCYERADDPGFGVSGVVTRARGIRAAFPDLDASQIPMATRVRQEKVLYLLDPVGASRRPPTLRAADAAIRAMKFAFKFESDAIELPYTPEFLHKQDGFVFSMGQLMQWMSGQVLSTGTVQIWPATPVAEALVEGKAVKGVRLLDLGVDLGANPETSFMPGMDVAASLTVVGDGPVGAVGRQLDRAIGLPAGSHGRRDWAVGMKLVVDLPEGTPLEPGTVLHTLGFPEPEIFGFLYVHPDGFARIGEGSGSTNVLTSSGVDEAFTTGVQLAEGVIELLEAGKPLTKENLDLAYVARRRGSWIEEEGRIAEKARDGFQKGVVTGLVGMALAGLTGGRMSLGGEPPHPAEKVATLEGFYAGKIPADEIAAIRKACEAKGVPLHDALMERAGWPAVPLDGKLLVTHQDALLVGGKVQAPPGYADHVTFLRPELCQGCGRKVCFEICSAEAIRPGEGGVPSFDREKCVHCGACLWSCTQRIDGTDEVNLQFRAGTGGLHSAEN